MLEKIFPGGSSVTSVALSLAFRILDEKTLRLSPNYDALQTWRFLSHQIRRYPLDLRAHVQRILLTHSEDLTDRMEGSLMDLYLALGNEAGLMLKERMLEQCSPYLSPEAVQFFKQLQTEDFYQGLDREWRLGSVLATGENQKNHSLITVERQVETSHYGSVLEEAQACLEYGQIDIAQELLEQEILAGHNNPAVEQELLNIYQYTRNKDKLNQLTSELIAAGIEPSETWKAQQSEANNW
ncbi:hypothetical protein [uncultured Thiothrix sp.]|jgi:hypothetical protein|uniref:hypothetical protein n=1 Tax=uncultured Thiothrix sp. TaxID=223185 RepID=UPI00261623C0|nr:hypothetical protein [uncultured Thiothrix sp.]HMT92146.1 hypothetical protein [Thiolinea sp.]